jgi:hypothetical protein
MSNVRNSSKLGIALLLCLRAHAQNAAVNSYTQTNLASDIEGMARYVDMNLVNPWGLSATGSTFAKAIFVSDHGTGFATRRGWPLNGMGHRPVGKRHGRRHPDRFL